MLDGYDRIIVENTVTGETLAVITDDEVTTASNEIVVRMRPVYDEPIRISIDAKEVFRAVVSSLDHEADEKHDQTGDNRANNCHTPIMRSVLSLLTNPAFFFGCLSGGLLAHFVLSPIILH